MDVDSGYKNVCFRDNFRGGVQRYMMVSKDFFSSISFELKNENIQLVSFNGQSINLRLSINKIFSYWMTKTLVKSRFLPHKKNKNKPELINTASSELPSKVQSFKQKLLSGKGFVESNQFF